MRNRIFISLLALFSLTACVYDNYTPDYCTEDGKPVYLSFVLRSTSGPLSTDDGTKGENPNPSYSAQTIAEQLVSRVDLYFYDGAGGYLGQHSQTVFNQTPQDDEISNVVGDFAVKLDYRPFRMLLTLNSSAAYDTDLKNLSLQAALEKIQKSSDYQMSAATTVKYKDKGTGSEVSVDVQPFYMSSSAYLSKAKVQICDIYIPLSVIKETEAEALRSPVDVYLERLAAKVTLKTRKVDFLVPVVTSQDSVVTNVKLIGWNVNTLNRESYYFKKINTAWDYTWGSATSPVYWNNTLKYRSYWAQDTNYESGKHSGINLAQQTAPLTGDIFLYRKPAELNKPLNLESGTYTGYTYCLENTADAGILPVTDSDVGPEEKTLYSRATHVLIKAQLSFSEGVDSSDDEDGFKTAMDFFRYKGMFYTQKGLLKALRRDTNNDADPTSSPLYGIDDSDLKLVSAADLSYCKGYDKGERVAVQRISDSSYPDLKDASGNPVRIDGFKDGYFYYKIPIEHINNEDVTGATYPIAKYGVVRNHNYEITLSEDLKGIGTGIWDDSFDIRPFRKTDDYRVTAYVRVSPWLQFETRFLFVDPSGMLVTDGQRVIMWADEGDPNKDGEGDNVWTGDGWYF